MFSMVCWSPYILLARIWYVWSLWQVICIISVALFFSGSLTLCHRIVWWLVLFFMWLVAVDLCNHTSHQWHLYISLVASLCVLTSHYNWIYNDIIIWFVWHNFIGGSYIGGIVSYKVCIIYYVTYTLRITWNYILQSGPHISFVAQCYGSYTWYGLFIYIHMDRWTVILIYGKQQYDCNLGYITTPLCSIVYANSLMIYAM